LQQLFRGINILDFPRQLLNTTRIVSKCVQRYLKNLVECATQSGNAGAAGTKVLVMTLCQIKCQISMVACSSSLRRFRFRRFKTQLNLNLQVRHVSSNVPLYRSHRRGGSHRLMAPVNICPRRLIDTYTLQLIEFSGNSTIPPYAILSHTWTHRREVVYTEYLQPRFDTFSKPGYQKIQLACRQAREDGIHYVWVDMCCINQGSHHDVAANIMSMYAYYQNAEVCYVYLADVWDRKDMFGVPHLKYTYTAAKWFHRGWTLQELLAPRTVIFFNRLWLRIGDRNELRDVIHAITTIPPSVLSGQQSIPDVDLMTRMTWSVNRSTTREQDEAYCLQGLLGVSIEPDYAESRWSAFNRLAKALGIREDLIRDPNSRSFVYLLVRKFSANSYKR